jgi:cardiolipin synthase A/B
MINTPRLRKQGYTTANKVSFVQGGREYFDKLKELIDNARKFIHLQVYIFNNDQTGLLIAEALIAAAKRGVQIYFLIDGYASEKPNEETLLRFKEAGVNYAPFEPLFRGKTFYFGRRMHHKVLVVDSMYSLVGGLNIADRYNDVDNIPAWLDFAACVYGEASVKLNALCCEMWNRYAMDCKATAVKLSEQEFNDIPDSQRCAIRVRQNDWVRRKYEIWRSYFDMFNHASDEIVIMCSYFLPGLVYRKRIEHALKKGVRIRVVTTGKSDVIVAKYAERYLYNWMLRNKVELYEYTGEMLHAKIAIRDSNWMTIGSYNVNNISALASIEMNLDIRNKQVVSLMQKKLEDIIENDTVRITEESLSHSHNLFMIFLYRCSYEFIRATLYLFTFYFRQEE